MSRAGYVPQMFSLRLPNPIVIFELLQRAGAHALVCEQPFGVDLSECPIPTYSAAKVHERDAADVALPPLRTDCSESDLTFIFHTSGSTSGSPKLVPCNRRWLDSIVTKSMQLGQVRSTRGQDVTVAMYGNFLHCLALILDLTFVFSRFTVEACATLDRQIVSCQRSRFSPWMLTDAHPTSVDRLAVSWFMYHSTYNRRFLFGRTA